MKKFFFDYSSSSKVYRIFNRRILVVKESIHIIFDETNIFKSKKVDAYYNASTLVKEVKEIILESPPS